MDPVFATGIIELEGNTCALFAWDAATFARKGLAATVIFAEAFVELVVAFTFVRTRAALWIDRQGAHTDALIAYIWLATGVESEPST